MITIKRIQSGLYKISNETETYYIKKHFDYSWIILSIETGEYSDYFRSFLEAKQEAVTVLKRDPSILLHHIKREEVEKYLIPSIVDAITEACIL